VFKLNPVASESVSDASERLTKASGNIPVNPGQAAKGPEPVPVYPEDPANVSEQVSV